MQLVAFNYSIDVLMSRKINMYYYVAIEKGIFGLTNLPNYQLLISSQILQIFFEYMHPIVSWEILSNKNVKNGYFKSIESEFNVSDLSFRIGI